MHRVEIRAKSPGKKLDQWLERKLEELAKPRDASQDPETPADVLHILGTEYKQLYRLTNEESQASAA